MPEAENDDPYGSFALALPGAWQDFPWGERVAKVGRRIFAWIGGDGIGVKLTASLQDALARDNVRPMGYGLGRHGWVEAPDLAGSGIDVATAHRWIEESYRIVAGRRLIAELDARAGLTPPAPAVTPRGSG